MKLKWILTLIGEIEGTEEVAGIGIEERLEVGDGQREREGEEMEEREGRDLWGYEISLPF